jgi:hypothetical protein
VKCPLLSFLLISLCTSSFVAMKIDQSKTRRSFCWVQVRFSRCRLRRAHTAVMRNRYQNRDHADRFFWRLYFSGLFTGSLPCQYKVFLVVRPAYPEKQREATFSQRSKDWEKMAHRCCLHRPIVEVLEVLHMSKHIVLVLRVLQDIEI